MTKAAVVEAAPVRSEIEARASSWPPCKPIENSKKIAKIRITGSGISRSDRISVAITPSKNAMVIGETRFSIKTSTGIRGARRQTPIPIAVLALIGVTQNPDAAYRPRRSITGSDEC